MLKRLFILFSIVMISLTAGCNATSEEIQFSDSQLASAIKVAAGLEDTDTITESDVIDIIELDAQGYGITHLQGIEALLELVHLNLQDNEIDDLSQLFLIENLETVLLYNNPLSLDTNEDVLSQIQQLEANGVTVHYDEIPVYEQTGAPAEGVFYKVEHGGNTVYLLGSIHVGMEDIYPLHPAIEDAFALADYLAVEIDMTTVSEFEMMELLASIGFYEDGESLQEAIGQNAFTELVTLLRPYGYDEMMLNLFKPFVVQDLLTMMAAEAAGLHPDDGIDLYFMDRASYAEMPIISLETIEEQLLLSTFLPEELQAMELIQSIEAFDQLTDEIIELMDVWRQGDTEALLAIRNAEIEEGYEDYMRALLDDRDLQMADRIEEFLLDESGSTYFVVVGAMHLVGDTSIAGLLKDRGYELQLGASN
ncbi:MAG: TraB/GumN family protein [Bacillus sp. (in: Bacteria)]|nr:TraB/GumN family protein [Bacillus sp. (in: firmicutes)]